MRQVLLRILALTAILALMILSAFAADVVELQLEKMDDILDTFIAFRLLPEGSALPEPNERQPTADTYQTSYRFNEYLDVTVLSDFKEGTSSYQLSIAMSGAPDDLDTRALYAAFAANCNHTEALTPEAARALIEELYEQKTVGDGYTEYVLERDGYTYEAFYSHSDSEVLFDVIIHSEQ